MGGLPGGDLLLVTATLMVPSSMRRPRDVIGSACSQAPDSLVVDASRRARALESGALSRRDPAKADALGKSQAFC